MHSLRARLFGLWLLSLAAGTAVAFMLFQIYRDSVDAQVARSEAVIARACDLIRDKYAFFVAGWREPAPAPGSADLRSSLANVVGLALKDQDGVEGGVWQGATGPLAYAYPTYEGSGPKFDLPAAERSEIEAINRQALGEQQPLSRRIQNRTQTLLLWACPLRGPAPGLTAWTMTRVTAARGFGPLLLGLGLLGLLLLVMAVWLGGTLLKWDRHVRRIETSLGRPDLQALPPLALTGERELDRIIGALNESGRRLATARREADTLAEQVARAERMASLGRVAAGVAHEIRNPIAAARLQGENAIAGDDARRARAIGEMLVQLGRLDGLVTELLAMTQKVTPVPIRVDLEAFLHACAGRHADVAAQRRVKLVTRESAGGQAVLDPAVVGRILDNLLANAIRHTSADGEVTVGAERGDTALTILVGDTGTGVAPDLVETLFEPFVTSRADGTGLGLAIAHELTDAHGGRLTLRRRGGRQVDEGAEFALELPQEPPWPSS